MSLSASPCLIVPRPVLAEMLAQAVAEAPLECCGVLGGSAPAAGQPPRAVRCYPLVNAAASPVAFESEPRCMFDAVRDMRRRALEIVAVYHSHPAAPPVPSRTDLERNFSEQVLNLIISLQTAQPEVRAWWLAADGYRPAAWALAEAASADA
jgi:[CysO sulfur-carrier protein]-S-L-cysteine hydrolase